VANLLVDAGNFAPLTKTATDSIKLRALLDFYRSQAYDALTLSTREVQLGLAPWEQAEKEHTPIVVANLYRGKHGKKLLFKPYVIKKDHGHQLGVIGFLSESAWKARRDTTLDASIQSPLAMGKLIKKVAKKSDHLTVIGDFTPAETDTLAKHFPVIDLIVSSGIKSAERARTVGNTVIIGSGSRGYFANYIDFAFNPADTVRFRPTAQSLDESLPVDSTVLKFVTQVSETIKSAVSPKH
jgi:2',3'-cyclic-nucleotide 2'-phosphodiesterase (5'-nucleotidase family)